MPAADEAAARVRSMFAPEPASSERVAVLMELVGSLSRATGPQEIYDRFRQGMLTLLVYDGYVSLSTRGLQPGEYKITRFERANAKTGGLEQAIIGSDNPWRDFPEMPVMRGGFIGELIRSAWPQIIHDLDVRDDPHVGALFAPYRSLRAIPLFDNGEPLNWSIALAKRPNAFTVEGLEEAILRANLVGGMIKNSLMAQELRAAHDRINKEVEQIAGIQRALLPDPLPKIEGVKVAASYATSELAGGDYYDFFPIDHRGDGAPDPSGRWGILIADASGHGPSAAVVMAMLHAILHAYPGRDDDPVDALAHANRHLCEKRIEGSFVTAFYGIYDARKRTLTYARAGHHPPLVKRGPVTARLDAVGGLPLGIDPEATFQAARAEFKRGETLVFFTDGVTEAMDARGRMFGIAGIEKALADCTGAAECTIDSIGAALRAHQRGGKIKDDQTIVAMEIV
jgi:sigma-B regulation protein RsbU (phosphoserine phosphatase)